MSYNNNYGSRQANMYDDRQAQSPGYNSPTLRSQQYGETPMGGRNAYGNGQNVELEPLANNGSQPGQDNTGATLAKCKMITNAVEGIETNDLPELKKLQQAALNSADPGSATAKLDAKSQLILDQYRELVGELRILKSVPGNQDEETLGGKQVKRIEGVLKAAMHAYQSADNDFSKKLKEQAARQYRIVRPDATEQEVRDAVESTDSAVFSQALMQGNRRGQSQSTLNAVQSRHAEIQKIEKQMKQIGELFQDMAAMVQEQEVAVVDIEMKGEEVVENMDKGNQEVGVAIQSAKNARKWKWWCLGLVVLIVIVIAIAIVAKIAADGGFKSKDPAPATASKRFVLPANHRVVSEYSGPPSAKREAEPFVMVEDLFKLTDGKIMVSDDWTPTTTKKARSFQA